MTRWQDVVWPAGEPLICSSYRPTAREQIAHELIARAREEREWQRQCRLAKKRRRREWWQAHSHWVLIAVAALLLLAGLWGPTP